MDENVSLAIVGWEHRVERFVHSVLQNVQVSSPS